jgi:hypothetical protein
VTRERRSLYGPFEIRKIAVRSQPAIVSVHTGRKRNQLSEQRVQTPQAPSSSLTPLGVSFGTKRSWVLRAGIDTSNATGRMVAGVLASLAELELELGKERRIAAREAPRERGRSIGRPKALDHANVALAQRMHASGESASTIASMLGASRATVYRRVLPEGGQT